MKITCDASGAVLTPIEEELVPNYEFSRAFNYSFTSLVQLPDVDRPRAASGLEVAVHTLTPQEGILDLGGVHFGDWLGIAASWRPLSVSRMIRRISEW